MDLSALQDNIHSVLENDSDTPESTDDTYITRTRLANQAIRQWENENEVSWNELWATKNDQTVTTSTTTYNAPSDFKAPGGFVRLIKNSQTTKIRVIPVEDYQTYAQEEYVAYFTGNPQDGYVLNLGWTPAASDDLTGATITYNYYKKADTLSATTDVPEMSDPMYIVYWVAAQQSRGEGDFNSFTVFFEQAQESLRNMRITNETNSNHQDDLLYDEEWTQDGVALGV